MAPPHRRRCGGCLGGGRLTYPFELIDYFVITALYSAVFITVGVLIWLSRARDRAYRGELASIGLLVVYPVFALIGLMAGTTIFGERDLAPLILLLGSWPVVVGVLRSRTMALVPLARSTVVEALSEVVFVADQNGLLVDRNRAARRLVPAAQVGLPVSERWPAWDTIAAVPSGEEVRLPLGEQVWAFTWQHVGASGILVTGRDATEQARTLEEVAAERAVAEETLRIIFENAYQFIGMLDPDGRVLAANRTALEAAEVPLSEIVGQPFHETPWWRELPEEAERLCGALEEAKKGRFVRFETVHRLGDTDIFVDFSITPVIRDGEVALLIPEGRDITPLRQAEEERMALQQQRAHSERLELLGQLSGSVAHDFNNLLTVILNAVVLLPMIEELSEDARSLLGDAEQASNSAAALTRQLLAFSRLNRSEGLSHTEVNEVIEQTARLLRRLLKDRHPLTVALHDGPTTILIDPHHLEQCVMNLVINAQDASQAGGAIRVTTTVQHEQVVLSVSDDGEGIPPEVLPHIFDPFFTTKPVGSGTGLGLTTLHGIVEAAGGTIAVESTPGEGTCFRLSFPYRPGTQAPQAPVIQELTGNEQVVLVEDVASLRELFSRELRRLGYDVYAFSSAEQLLSQGDLRPDILITDIVLGGMNGIRLAARLRDAQPDLRVIFTTGHSKDRREELLRFPDSTLLHKPFQVSELAQTVRDAFSP